jgi:hypothetical protein
MIPLKAHHLIDGVVSDPRYVGKWLCEQMLVMVYGGDQVSYLKLERKYPSFRMIGLETSH